MSSQFLRFSSHVMLCTTKPCSSIYCYSLMSFLTAFMSPPYAFVSYVMVHVYRRTVYVEVWGYSGEQRPLRTHFERGVISVFQDLGLGNTSTNDPVASTLRSNSPLVRLDFSYQPCLSASDSYLKDWRDDQLIYHGRILNALLAVPPSREDDYCWGCLLQQSAQQMPTILRQ
jgi:hypothetical protein